MKISVKLSSGTKSISVPEGATPGHVLKRLGINSETVLVKRGKEIIMEDEALEGKDEIEIIKVVSGG
jgi:sulfur carrier protein ThiS